MSINKDNKNKLFKLIQNYINTTPVVVWGSGATVDYKMPTMLELNNTIGQSVPEFNASTNNLEKELSKSKYAKKFSVIQDVIWNEMFQADAQAFELILENPSKFDPIKNLILKLLEPHPKQATIVTTNYDLVLERVMAYNKISFSDGFAGYELTRFTPQLLEEHKMSVNLIKVHGSLSWFNLNGNIVRSERKVNNNFTIIPPGKNKYLMAFQEPYRELIQLSDNAISKAKCFLVIGFGFNDAHLTPKIVQAVNEGVPIVIITKSITPTTKKVLENAQNYVFIEEYKNDTSKTQFTFRKDKKNVKSCILSGNFWKLGDFLKII